MIVLVGLPWIDRALYHLRGATITTPHLNRGVVEIDTSVPMNGHGSHIVGRVVRVTPVTVMVERDLVGSPNGERTECIAVPTNRVRKVRKHVKQGPTETTDP
jgi:hypothetical protein